jgi:hypothetical protein
MQSVRRRLDRSLPSTDKLGVERLVEGLLLVERVHRKPRKYSALEMRRKDTMLGLAGKVESFRHCRE